MLARNELRRYLTALLRSEDIPQTPDCLKGPIWQNCGCPADVIEEAEDSVDTDAPHEGDEVTLLTHIIREAYTFEGDDFCRVSLTAQISIVACADYGRARADILDEVEQRVLLRLLAAPIITDEAGNQLRSPLRMALENSATVTVQDDRAFESNRTMRVIEISFTARPCIEMCCELPPICFDFTKLPTPKGPNA